MDCTLGMSLTIHMFGCDFRAQMTVTTKCWALFGSFLPRISLLLAKVGNKKDDSKISRDTFDFLGVRIVSTGIKLVSTLVLVRLNNNKS